MNQTFEDLKRNPAYFLRPEHQDPKDIDVFLKMVKYAEDLLRQNNKDPKETNPYKVFGMNYASDTLTYASNKNQVNQRVFEYLQTRGPEIKTPVLEKLKNAIGQRQRELEVMWADMGNVAIENKRREHLNKIEMQFQRYLETWRQMISDIPVIENIDSFLESIKKAVENNSFFEFMEIVTIDQKAIRFETTADIVLKEINPSAGLNHEVNFGRFILTINLESLNMVIRPRHKPGHPNLQVNGNFHPHLSNNGGLCFGEGIFQYHEAVLHRDILGILNLVEHLLKTYGAASPYQPLIRFQKEQDRIRRITATPKIPEAFLGLDPLTGRCISAAEIQSGRGGVILENNNNQFVDWVDQGIPGQSISFTTSVEALPLSEAEAETIHF